MNILKYHMQQKGMNATQLSAETGMNYHKLTRLLRQDSEHVETQLEASLEIVHLFEVLGLEELSQSIKKQVAGEDTNFTFPDSEAEYMRRSNPPIQTWK